MSSAGQKSNKKQIDPFTMMGTRFKDLDESRFMKGTKSYKLAVERLNNRAAQVPQPTPPPSDGESDTESPVLTDTDCSPFVFIQSRPAPHITQRDNPPEVLSATVVSHQHRQKNDTRVLKQPPTSVLPTGLTTPPPSDRKKVVRMVRTSTGALVKKEIEIVSTSIVSSSQQRPIPAPNFGLQFPPAAKQKEGGAYRKSADKVKQEPELDDDYVHLHAPSLSLGTKQTSSATKTEQDDLNNPFLDFQPLLPSLSAVTKVEPEAKLGPQKHQYDVASFGPRMSLKTEVRPTETKAQIALRRSIRQHALMSPETTPIKQEASYPGSRQYDSPQHSQVINGRDLISRLSPDDPFQKKPVNKYGPFRSLLAKPVRLLRLSTPRIYGNDELFPAYVADNGDTLEWYQAFDVEDLVAESVAREVMRLDQDSLLYDVPHGRILAYEMGMGKTHVALSVIAETFSQTQALHNHRGLELTRNPVLIVAEKSLQSQWEKHAKSLFNFKVAVYSENRQIIPSDVDVIVVNIHLLRNQHKQRLEDEGNQIQKRRKCLFFDASFSYLIVDEFHQYNNPTTLSARALLNIKTNNVLLLSGTPAQNKLDDLQLPLALLQHPDRRKDFREIERALRKAKNERALKALDIVNSHKVNDKTLIEQTFITRRILDGLDGSHALTLPPRTNTVVHVELTPAEYRLHEHMYTRETGFVRFLRCRQASLDPRLLLDSGALDTSFEAEIGSKDIEDVTDEFDIVMVDVGDLPSSKEKPPSYDTAAKAALLEFKEELQDDYLPSKTQVALQLLRGFRKKGEKALIFSNFTMLLYRLSESLDDHGIGYTYYHGRMDRNQRDSALSTLANDDKCSVMLVSIKAGGLGLNITAANNVIIMDPWWNPYVEEQAIARVYRIGQTRQVDVFRLITPETVERKIVQTQDRKRNEVGAFLDKTALTTKERDGLRHSHSAF